MMYLKHFHPLEFWISALVCEQDDLGKVANYINAMRAEKTDIDILPPDVNLSDRYFTIDKGSIRYGLGAIMNLGKSADIILQERIANGPYKSVIDFLDRVPARTVNKRIIENLMYVNAFSSFGNTKEVYDEMIRYGKKLDDLELGEEFLALKEMKLLGTNISFVHPAMELAKHYPAFPDILEEETSLIAVSVMKIFNKVTKKNKPYTLLKCQCLRSGEVFNVFDWGNNETAHIEEGKIEVINIHKSNFITLRMKRR
jgi:DNA polymerase III alpha subunit